MQPDYGPAWYFNWAFMHDYFLCAKDKPFAWLFASIYSTSLAAVLYLLVLLASVACTANRGLA